MPKPDLKNLPIPAQLATAEQQEKWLWRINAKLIQAYNNAGSDEARRAILRKQKNVLHQINQMRDQTAQDLEAPYTGLKYVGAKFSDHDNDIDLDKIQEMGN
jgi:hypothetical protein